MRPKALCLLSGGLDSTLAARIVIDLGVELEAVNYVTAFCTCTPRSMKAAGCAAAVSAARTLGIRVRTFDATGEMLELVRDPPHGWGSFLNPCIDCRINMFRRALGVMKETGAGFLVTGEVLGERPMSQRRDAMLLIEREAGLDGLVLRPLSAALLDPSIPEREGWVDRGKMLSISGRSRRPQIALAREVGIGDYPCPAGGCRLTDPGYAGRMKDLLDHLSERASDQRVTPNDARLLRWGRHFRLSPRAKAVVGRNEEENARIAALARPGDVVADPVELPGPTTLLRGRSGEAELALACGIAASYTAQDADAVEFELEDAASTESITAPPLPRDARDTYMIAPLKPGWRRGRIRPRNPRHRLDAAT